MVSGILLEILQLLQRHWNGLDQVEREVHIFQLGQLARVLRSLVQLGILNKSPPKIAFYKFHLWYTVQLVL